MKIQETLQLGKMRNLWTVLGNIHKVRQAWKWSKHLGFDFIKAYLNPENHNTDTIQNKIKIWEG